MIKLSENDIDLIAPNAEAAKNGRALWAKNKLSMLSKSADNTLLFGQCAGSGQNPYYCSADYLDPTAPVYRCNCPSRQFPCKHVLGLLTAYAKGQEFVVADIPTDVADKRNKQAKRQEKKEQAAPEEQAQPNAKPKSPSKAKSGAAIKKIEGQLEGIQLAKQLLRDMLQTGLSSVDTKMKQGLAEQMRQLGNYYIAGIQTAFNDLLQAIEQVQHEEYTLAIDRVNYLNALLRRAEEYLTTRKEAPEQAPDTQSAIEEQIGYAWKLTELRDLGLAESEVELVQLAFRTYDDTARREWVDEGYWIDLKAGRILRTLNYRPYKAVKYVKADDSCFDVLQPALLYLYPGEVNNRIRWEGFSLRPLSPDDIAKVQSFAHTDIAATIKMVKGIIKSPLANKNPIVLLRAQRAYSTAQGQLVIEDEQGNKLTLANLPHMDMPVIESLQSFLPADISGLSLLLLCHNDIAGGNFVAYPLAVVGTQHIVRLLY